MAESDDEPKTFLRYLVKEGCFVRVHQRRKSGSRRKKVKDKAAKKNTQTGSTEYDTISSGESKEKNDVSGSADKGQIQDGASESDGDASSQSELSCKVDTEDVEHQRQKIGRSKSDSNGTDQSAAEKVSRKQPSNASNPSKNTQLIYFKSQTAGSLDTSVGDIPYGKYHKSLAYENISESVGGKTTDARDKLLVNHAGDSFKPTSKCEIRCSKFGTVTSQTDAPLSLFDKNSGIVNQPSQKSSTLTEAKLLRHKTHKTFTQNEVIQDSYQRPSEDNCISVKNVRGDTHKSSFLLKDPRHVEKPQKNDALSNCSGKNTFSLYPENTVVSDTAGGKNVRCGISRKASSHSHTKGRGTSDKIERKDTSDCPGKKTSNSHSKDSSITDRTKWKGENSKCHGKKTTGLHSKDSGVSDPSDCKDLTSNSHWKKSTCPYLKDHNTIDKTNWKGVTSDSHGNKSSTYHVKYPSTAATSQVKGAADDFQGKKASVSNSRDPGVSCASGGRDVRSDSHTKRSSSSKSKDKDRSVSETSGRGVGSNSHRKSCNISSSKTKDPCVSDKSYGRDIKIHRNGKREGDIESDSHQKECTSTHSETKDPCVSDTVDRDDRSHFHSNHSTSSYSKKRDKSFSDMRSDYQRKKPSSLNSKHLSASASSGNWLVKDDADEKRSNSSHSEDKVPYIPDTPDGSNDSQRKRPSSSHSENKDPNVSDTSVGGSASHRKSSSSSHSEGKDPNVSDTSIGGSASHRKRFTSSHSEGKDPNVSDTPFGGSASHRKRSSSSHSDGKDPNVSDTSVGGSASHRKRSASSHSEDKDPNVSDTPFGGSASHRKRSSSSHSEGKDPNVSDTPVGGSASHRKRSSSSHSDGKDPNVSDTPVGGSASHRKRSASSPSEDKKRNASDTPVGGSASHRKRSASSHSEDKKRNASDTPVGGSASHRKRSASSHSEDKKRNASDTPVGGSASHRKRSASSPSEGKDPNVSDIPGGRSHTHRKRSASSHSEGKKHNASDKPNCKSDSDRKRSASSHSEGKDPNVADLPNGRDGRSHSNRKRSTSSHSKDRCTRDTSDAKDIRSDSHRKKYGSFHPQESCTEDTSNERNVGRDLHGKRFSSSHLKDSSVAVTSDGRVGSNSNGKHSTISQSKDHHTTEKSNKDIRSDSHRKRSARSNSKDVSADRDVTIRGFDRESSSSHSRDVSVADKATWKDPTSDSHGKKNTSHSKDSCDRNSVKWKDKKCGSQNTQIKKVSSQSNDCNANDKLNWKYTNDPIVVNTGKEDRTGSCNAGLLPGEYPADKTLSSDSKDPDGYSAKDTIDDSQTGKCSSSHLEDTGTSCIIKSATGDCDASKSAGDFHAQKSTGSSDARKSTGDSYARKSADDSHSWKSTDDAHVCKSVCDSHAHKSTGDSHAHESTGDSPAHKSTGDAHARKSPDGPDAHNSHSRKSTVDCHTHNSSRSHSKDSRKYTTSVSDPHKSSRPHSEDSSAKHTTEGKYTSDVCKSSNIHSVDPIAKGTAEVKHTLIESHDCVSSSLNSKDFGAKDTTSDSRASKSTNSHPGTCSKSCLKHQPNRKDASSGVAVNSFHSECSVTKVLTSMKSTDDTSTCKSSSFPSNTVNEYVKGVENRTQTKVDDSEKQTKTVQSNAVSKTKRTISTDNVRKEDVLTSGGFKMKKGRLDSHPLSKERLDKNGSKSQTKEHCSHRSETTSTTDSLKTIESVPKMRHSSGPVTNLGTEVILDSGKAVHEISSVGDCVKDNSNSKLILDKKEVQSSPQDKCLVDVGDRYENITPLEKEMEKSWSKVRRRPSFGSANQSNSIGNKHSVINSKGQTLSQSKPCVDAEKSSMRDFEPCTSTSKKNTVLHNEKHCVKTGSQHGPHSDSEQSPQTRLKMDIIKSSQHSTRQNSRNGSNCKCHKRKDHHRKSSGCVKKRRTSKFKLFLKVLVTATNHVLSSDDMMTAKTPPVSGPVENQNPLSRRQSQDMFLESSNIYIDVSELTQQSHVSGRLPQERLQNFEISDKRSEARDQSHAPRRLSEETLLPSPDGTGNRSEGVEQSPAPRRLSGKRFLSSPDETCNRSEVVEQSPAPKRLSEEWVLPSPDETGNRSEGVEQSPAPKRLSEERFLPKRLSEEWVLPSPDETGNRSEGLEQSPVPNRLSEERFLSSPDDTGNRSEGVEQRPAPKRLSGERFLPSPDETGNRLEGVEQSPAPKRLSEERFLPSPHKTDYRSESVELTSIPGGCLQSLNNATDRLGTVEESILSRRFSGGKSLQSHDHSEHGERYDLSKIYQERFFQNCSGSVVRSEMISSPVSRKQSQERFVQSPPNSSDTFETVKENRETKVLSSEKFPQCFDNPSDQSVTIEQSPVSKRQSQERFLQNYDESIASRMQSPKDQSEVIEQNYVPPKLCKERFLQGLDKFADRTQETSSVFSECSVENTMGQVDICEEKDECVQPLDLTVECNQPLDLTVECNQPLDLVVKNSDGQMVMGNKKAEITVTSSNYPEQSECYEWISSEENSQNCLTGTLSSVTEVENDIKGSENGSFNLGYTERLPSSSTLNLQSETRTPQSPNLRNETRSYRESFEWISDDGSQESTSAGKHEAQMLISEIPENPYTQAVGHNSSYDLISDEENDDNDDFTPGLSQAKGDLQNTSERKAEGAFFLADSLAFQNVGESGQSKVHITETESSACSDYVQEKELEKTAEKNQAETLLQKYVGSGFSSDSESDEDLPTFLFKDTEKSDNVRFAESNQSLMFSDVFEKACSNLIDGIVKENTEDTFQASSDIKATDCTVVHQVAEIEERVKIKCEPVDEDIIRNIKVEPPDDPESSVFVTEHACYSDKAKEIKTEPDDSCSERQPESCMSDIKTEDHTTDSVAENVDIDASRGTREEKPVSAVLCKSPMLSNQKHVQSRPVEELNIQSSKTNTSIERAGITCHSSTTAAKHTTKMDQNMRLHIDKCTSVGSYQASVSPSDRNPSPKCIQKAKNLPHPNPGCSSDGKKRKCIVVNSGRSRSFSVKAKQHLDSENSPKKKGKSSTSRFYNSETTQVYAAENADSNTRIEYLPTESADVTSESVSQSHTMKSCSFHNDHTSSSVTGFDNTDTFHLKDSENALTDRTDAESFPSCLTSQTLHLVEISPDSSSTYSSNPKRLSSGSSFSVSSEVSSTNNTDISDQVSATCSICNKNFDNQTSLNHHMRIHGEKHHKCEVCTKTFYSAYHLKQHLMVHTGGQPNKCTICGKILFRQSSLKIHMIKHAFKKNDEEKDYKDLKSSSKHGKMDHEISTRNMKSESHAPVDMAVMSCGRDSDDKGSGIIPKTVGETPEKMSPNKLNSNRDSSQNEADSTTTTEDDQTSLRNSVAWTADKIVKTEELESLMGHSDVEDSQETVLSEDAAVCTKTITNIASRSPPENVKCVSLKPSVVNSTNMIVSNKKDVDTVMSEDSVEAISVSTSRPSEYLQTGYHSQTSAFEPERVHTVHEDTPEETALREDFTDHLPTHREPTSQCDTGNVHKHTTNQNQTSDFKSTRLTEINLHHDVPIEKENMLTNKPTSKEYCSKERVNKHRSKILQDPPCHDEELPVIANDSIISELSDDKRVDFETQDVSNGSEAFKDVNNILKDLTVGSEIMSKGSTSKSKYGSGKSYKCEVCEKVFHSTASLKGHMNVHIGQRVKCDICDKLLSCQAKLDRHMALHTVQEKDKEKLFPHSPVKCQSADQARKTEISDSTPVCNETSNDTGPSVTEMSTVDLENVERNKSQDCVVDEVKPADSLNNHISSTTESSISNHRGQELSSETENVSKKSGQIITEGCKDSRCLQNSVQYPHAIFKKSPSEHCEIRRCQTANIESVVSTSETPKPGSEALSTCSVCGKCFQFKASLSHHMKIHNERTFKCEICNKGFYSTSNLNQHMVVHTGATNKCTICFKLISSASNMKIHMDIHAKRKPWPCSDCGKQFSCRSSLRLHRFTHNNQKLKCNFCDKVFGDPKLLERHVKVHGERKFKCPTCGKPFKRQSHLKGHLVLHTGQKDFKCYVCAATFTESGAFQQHLSCHTDQTDFRCDICGKEFHSFEDLRVHLRSHPDLKAYKCHICSKSFRHEATIKLHMRVHTGERPYTCQICGKTFTQASHLKTHQKVHKEKTVECENCDRKFKGVKELEDHMETHASRKAYECDICKGRFFSMKSIRRHKQYCRKTVKPFQCSECECRFSTAATLTAHKKRHGQEGEFPCDICNKTFRMLLKLERHKKIIHGVGNFKCLLCECVTKTAERHDIHMKEHETEQGFHCSKCADVLSDFAGLKLHMKKHSVPGPKKSSKVPKCDICNTTFSRHSVLRAHITKEHNSTVETDTDRNDSEPEMSRNPECLQSVSDSNQDSQTLTSEFNIRETQVFKEGDRISFKCPMCGNEYSKERHLKKHIAKRHSEGKTRSHSTNEGNDEEDKTQDSETGKDITQDSGTGKDITQDSGTGKDITQDSETGKDITQGTLTCSGQKITDSDPSRKPEKITSAAGSGEISDLDYKKKPGNSKQLSDSGEKTADANPNRKPENTSKSSCSGKVTDSDPPSKPGNLSKSSNSSKKVTDSNHHSDSAKNITNLDSDSTLEKTKSDRRISMSLEREDEPDQTKSMPTCEAASSCSSESESMTPVSPRVRSTQSLAPVAGHSPPKLPPEDQIPDTDDEDHYTPSNTMSQQKETVDQATSLTENKNHKPFKCTVCNHCCAKLSHLEKHKLKHEGNCKSNSPLKDRKRKQTESTSQEEKGSPSPKKKMKRDNTKESSPKEKTFDCEICRKSFSEPGFLRHHMKKHSDDCRTCDQCGRKFSDESHLQQHLKHHSEELKKKAEDPKPDSPKTHKCDICEKTFTSKSNLKEHTLIHTGERPYKCSFCDRSFGDKKSLSVHKLRHTGIRKYSCDVCGKKFYESGSLKAHMRIHTGELPFKCPVCGKGCSEQGGLKSHMKIHTGLKPHKCDICNKRFSGFSAMRVHKKIHTVERNFGCNLCDKQFASEEGLVIHMKIHSNDRQFECKTCGKSFTTKKYLANHELCHSDERSFKCDECEMTFKTQSYLKSHKKTHEEPGEFNCEVCEKSYPRLNYLQAHMKRHDTQKSFQCDICSNTFQDRSNFMKHKLIHTDRTRHFSCDICKKNFFTRQALKSHLATHQESGSYKCLECGVFLRSLGGLKTHYRIHNNELPFECNICKKRFRQNSNLQTHMIIHRGTKLFKCTICEKRFNHPNTLKKHVSVEHDGQEKKLYECPICHKKLTSSLSSHMKIHTDDRPYKCSVCDAAFSRADSLRTHSVIHTGEKAFECEICKKKFAQKSSLTTHLRFHTGERPYPCKLCDKSFTQASHLRTHEKGVHLNLRRHKCDVCGKAFNSAGYLKTHMLGHSGLKPFQCKVCQKEFSRPSSLKSHMLVHTGIKNFTCTVCEKSFAHANSLKSHMLHHTGEKPYTCDLCDAAFPRLDTLKNHKLSHTGERPFPCEICDNTFKTAGSLKSHMSIHSGSAFPCDVCGKLLSSQSSLKKHLQIHSGDLPHSCDQCGKAFISVASLKRHQTAAHSGDTFKCELCGKELSSPSSLKTHMKLHGDKEHECHECGKQFHKLASLRSHMYLHNPEDKPFKCDTCGKGFPLAGSLKTHKLSHLEDGDMPFHCLYCQKGFTQKINMNKHIEICHEGEEKDVKSEEEKEEKDEDEESETEDKSDGSDAEDSKLGKEGE